MTTSRYVIARGSGEEVASAPDMRAALDKAIGRLQDDPELGDLDVYREEGEKWIHERSVVHAPDDSWDTVIKVLMPGEPIPKPNAYLPRRITEEDLEGYDLGDPKRLMLEERLGEWT